MSFLSRFGGGAAPLPSLSPQRLTIDRFNLGSFEMLIMRLAFAAVAYFAIKWEVGSLHDANPDKLTGIAHWINIDGFQHLEAIGLWKILTVIGLMIYAAGILPALSLFPALFFSIGIGTLANSQGAINHSTQLVSMILLGQFLVYLIPLHFASKLGPMSWIKPSLPVQQRAIYVSLVVFAAAYVVSGWTKLDRSDGEWIERVPMLALQLQKSNWSEYYDTLKPVPATLETVVSLMNEHPTLARIFFGGGLFVELFAFLILIGRRWAFFYGLIIIVMHMSISRLMQLDFWYHILVALIFAVNVPGILKTFRRRNDLGL